jgi:DNA-binding PadR family transcriptional regulator
VSNPQAKISFSGRAGLLPLYILNALSKGSLSGYEIMKQLSSLTEGAWRPGSGSIYPVLKSLEKKGLVKVAGRGLRHKRVYTATKLGLQALRQAKKEYDEISIQRWHMVRGIMMTLVEPPSLARMLNEAIEMQPKAWERVLGSPDLSTDEKVFLLKQHLLMLDRHREWVQRKISELESTPPSGTRSQ